jgi:hypothetical protein
MPLLPNIETFDIQICRFLRSYGENLQIPEELRGILGGVSLGTELRTELWWTMSVS